MRFEGDGLRYLEEIEEDVKDMVMLLCPVEAVFVQNIVKKSFMKEEFRATKKDVRTLTL